MGYTSNVVASVEYQIKRRLQNPSAYIISIAWMLGFIEGYRRLFLHFWPGIKQMCKGYETIMYIVVMYTTSLLTNGLHLLGYHLIDIFKLFENRKITKSGALWQTDPKAWEQLRNKSIRLNFLNIVVIGFLSVFIDSLFLEDNIISTQIPSFSTIIFQLFIFTLFDGLLFTVMHKLGHTTALYKYHKIHHQFKVPSTLATNHNHPIDYFIGTAIPFAVGPKLLYKQTHLITLTLWLIFKLSEGYDAHSNYELPWSPSRVLPHATSSQYHSFHHTHNQGNYSGIELSADTLLNYNSAFFKFLKQKQIKQLKVKSK